MVIERTTTWTELNYRDAHRRLHRKPGRAAGQPSCFLCPDPAKQWALVPKLTKKLRSYREGWHQFAGRKQHDFAKWSIDPAAYVPLCRECHEHLDLRTHCRKGHPFEVRWVGGKRVRRCQVCLKTRQAEAYQRRKARAAVQQAGASA